MLAACVRLTMSRRARPIESALESSAIDCAQSVLVAHDALTLPTVHVPALQRPGARA